MASVPSLLNASASDGTSSTNRRRPAVLDICNLLCTSSSTTTKDPILVSSSMTGPTARSHHYHYYRSSHSFKTALVSKKRKRATATQLEVLNRVFEQTLFPSTQLRTDLGKQLGMSPRTVQIWFQNRRQALRIRERQITRTFH